MPALIRTAPHKLSDLPSVILARCSLCEKGQDIVAVEYTTAQAADYGRLHLQNTHSTVRWQQTGYFTEGRLPGCEFSALNGWRTDGTYTWAIFDADGMNVAGGISDSGLEAQQMAEAWLLNDSR